jgi:hypothetical protein
MASPLANEATMVGSTADPQLDSAGYEQPIQCSEIGHSPADEDLISETGNSHFDPCDFTSISLPYASETVEKVSHSVPC